MTTGILKDKNLDAMVITDPFNMRYVSGFRGGEGKTSIFPIPRKYWLRILVIRSRRKTRVILR